MIMMRSLSILGLLVLAGGHALAQEPDALGTFNDWEAYAYKANDAKVCFAFSKPTKSEASKKVRRDEVRFMVTNHTGQKVKGQVSTIIGYPFKEGSAVKLTIDETSFEMFPQGDMAWAGDSDKDIVEAMKAGSTMTLSGTSWKGTDTTDSYSLTGISAAIDKINEACK